MAFWRLEPGLGNKRPQVLRQVAQFGHGLAGWNRAGLVANYNAVPWGDRLPQDPSGLRLGSPAMTTRVFGEAEFRQVAKWIDRVVSSGLSEDAITRVGKQVQELEGSYPMP